MTSLNVVGIDVIVLVLLKMMVLKDGQLTGAEVRYDTLDTSRNSVVKFVMPLNTPLILRDVMEGGIVMEDNLVEISNVSVGIVVIVLLRVKSKEPEIVQEPNTPVPNVNKVSGGNVNIPLVKNAPLLIFLIVFGNVPVNELLSLKAFTPIVSS